MFFNETRLHPQRGEQKQQKSTSLFASFLRPPRARRFASFSRKSCSRFLFSLMSLSSSLLAPRVCFLKKVAENRSVGCFFSLEKSRAFSTTKPLSKRPVIYISLYSFTHNKYYNDAYHSSLAEARKRKRECLLLLYLSRSCCCCLNAKERARSFLLKAKFIIVFLSCG